MAFLFKSKPKSAQELVRNLKESLTALDKKDIKKKDLLKAQEAIAADVAQMKFLLYGDLERPVKPDIVNQLYDAVQAAEVLGPLVLHLVHYDSGTKKGVVAIFNNILRPQIGDALVTVAWLEKNPNVLTALVMGYDTPDIALPSGAMLRECIHYENLAKIVLHSPVFYNFPTYVEDSNFDSAWDAFRSLRELLTKHKALCSEFLEANYDKVFEMYNKLLNSENYVTRRHSLKLLGELLVDCSNVSTMLKYISSPDNLNLMMALLCDTSRSIRFEAFHVFKVFVANPKKTDPVLDILVRNKDKLIVWLNNFRNDDDDEQFNEEKGFLLKQISALGP